MSTRRHEPSGVAVHEFVQLLAGWAPDDKLATVRHTLASGEPAAAAAAAAAAVVLVTEHDVPLLAESIAAARSLVGEPGPLKRVRPVARCPRLPFWFGAPGPGARPDSAGLDRVMAQAAQARRAQIAGAWQTWRFPRDGSGEPQAGPWHGDPARAHRVYTVQVPDGTVAPALAGELQATLAAHGNASVEVIALDTAPPPYQAAALEGSVLLWAAQDGEPSFMIARVFDFAEPDTGPGFHPGHRVVTDSAERDRMLDYLTSGTPVLESTARTSDVLNPEVGQVVPASFRTDGDWIWTDTVAYYLRQHGMAPDEELTTHIATRWQAGDAGPRTDHQTALAAANFLLSPSLEHTREPSLQHTREAVWTREPAANPATG